MSNVRRNVSPVLCVADQEVSLSRLWRPEMGLSRSAVGRRQAAYKLTADKSVLLTALEVTYEDCIQELKRDDRITGNTDFFGQAGYPPLKELLGQPALLSKVMATYFEEEVFNAVLMPLPSNLVGTYAVGSVNSVRCEGESLVIEGICYEF